MDLENRRRDHAYRLSYQYEVGSSFDPDMVNLDTGEKLRNNCPSSLRPALLTPLFFLRPAEEQVPDVPQENEVEQEDLADYADEYVNYVGLEEIADELFEWSDWDADAPPGNGGDVTMAS